MWMKARFGSASNQTNHEMDKDERKTADDESLSNEEEDEYKEYNGEGRGEMSGPDVAGSSYDGSGDGDDDSNEEGSADAASSIDATATRKKLPGHPNVIQIIQRPRTHVNHSYRDLSAIPNDGTYSLPNEIDRMSFPEKLYHLLSSTSSYAQESIVWRHHGRAFCLKSEDYLQKYGLLKLYFGYARIQRFFKQLLNHDFKQITHGPDNGCFYNEVSICTHSFSATTTTCSLFFLYSIAVLSQRNASSSSILSCVIGTTTITSRSRKRTQFYGNCSTLLLAGRS